MLSLNLPVFDTKIATRNGKNVIFDVIRRRYVALTPEEWVRQHFVHFLIVHKGYPSSLMANEVLLNLNGTKKRCDTVLYKRDLSANTIVAGWIMILKVIRFCRIFRIMTLYKINNVNDSFRHLLSSFQEVNIVNARS